MRWLVTVLLVATPVAQVAAQVAISPGTMRPGHWERIALQVANTGDLATVQVAVRVPDAVTIIGLDAPAGWTVERMAPTDTSSQQIVWSGELEPGSFREFALLGRLAADVRRRELVFPVGIIKSDGSVIAWVRGGDAPPPMILIRGTTVITGWGAIALAGAAFGTAVLALGFALARRPRI